MTKLCCSNHDRTHIT